MEKDSEFEQLKMKGRQYSVLALVSAFISTQTFARQNKMHRCAINKIILFSTIMPKKVFSNWRKKNNF
jgi:hypothetical protein